MGGASLAEATGGIDVSRMVEITDTEEDPFGYDLSTTLLLAHPDVVFDGGDSVFFGAYDRKTGELIAIEVFE